MISYAVEIDNVRYFADPDTCTTSIACFKRSATRTTKWAQTPSGAPATTEAQLLGANNSQTFNPTRLTRQMAANKLGYRGAVRDTYLGWERDRPTARSRRIADTFDPAPKADRAVGIDDVINGAGGFIGDAVGGVGQVVRHSARRSRKDR